MRGHIRSVLLLLLIIIVSPTFSYADTAEQRGFLLFQQVCSTCHSMEQAHYGDMVSLSPSLPALKAWSKQHNATLTSPISSPYATIDIGKAANGGDFPPDLSHIARTIKGGSLYIEQMLQGYKTPPSNIKLPPYSYYNPLALTHHHSFHMPAPLHDGMLQYPDGTKATTAQMAHDVTAFLKWSDDSHYYSRILIGCCIIIYLLIMLGLTFTFKKSVWQNLLHK